MALPLTKVFPDPRSPLLIRPIRLHLAGQFQISLSIGQRSRHPAAAIRYLKPEAPAPAIGSLYRLDAVMEF